MRDEPFIVNYFSAKDGYLYFSDYWTKRLGSKSASSPVLRVEFKNGRKAYFSWSPQSLNISDNSVVFVSATYAKKLGINDGEKVTISYHNHVASVSRVFVSPMSSDDFEILAMNQDLLQSGLLDQIQIVWPGQTFVAWVGTSMHVVLYVDSLEPVTEVGRLQLLTEIIVNDPTEKQAQGDTSVNESSKESQNHKNVTVNEDGISLNKTNSVVSFLWDSVQGISSRLWRKEDLEKSAGNKNDNILHNNMKFIQPVVYRIHPFHFDDDSNISPLLTQPCNAYVHKRNWPSSIPCSAGYLIVKVTPVTSLSKLTTSTNEDEKKAKEKDHDLDISSVYVKLCIIEDLLDSLTDKTKCEVEETFKYSGQRCIFLPSAVRAALQVAVGARVKLNVEAQPLKRTPCEVELTSVGMCMATNDLDTLWKNYVLKLSKGGDIVINSGVTIPLRLSGGRSCYTQVKVIEPAVPYCILTSDNLKKCKLKVSSTRSPSVLTEDLDALNLNSIGHHHCFSHLEKEVIRGLTCLEITLGLTCVPWASKDSLISVVNTLVLGRRGSGASTFAKHLCDKLRKPPWFVHFAEIQCRNIKGKKVETLHRIISQALLECSLHEPAILLLQDLDVLAASPAQDQDVAVQENSYYTRVGEMLQELLRDFQPTYKIAVIATAGSCAKLNSSLMSPRGQHTFLSVLKVPDLSKDDRIKILEKLIEKKVSLEKSQLNLSAFAQKSDGYVVQDLVDFVEKAVFEAWKRKVGAGDRSECAPSLENVDLEKAFPLTQPLALHNVDLVQDSGLTWSDIGGLEHAKKLLVEMLEWPVQFPELFAQAPLRLQSGILLYGAPGTGKTLLAGAVAKECGLNFISVKGPELLSKYIGASEEAVRTIFLKAQSAKPCVLFFDEFDSLAPRRGHDSTGVTDRVVNQLLTQLDGVESLSSVWVLAATSRPDLLDPALLRPGRLDHAVLCPLPSQEDRLAILLSLSRKMCLACDVDFVPLAASSPGFTGADLQAVLYTAQLAAVDQESPLESSAMDPSSSAKTEREPAADEHHFSPIRVTQSHLLAALKETRPSLNLQERRKYEVIYANFEKSRTSSTGQKSTSFKQKVTLA